MRGLCFAQKIHFFSPCIFATPVVTIHISFNGTYELIGNIAPEKLICGSFSLVWFGCSVKGVMGKSTET